MTQVELDERIRHLLEVVDDLRKDVRRLLVISILVACLLALLLVVLLP